MKVFSVGNLFYANKMLAYDVSKLLKQDFVRAIWTIDAVDVVNFQVSTYIHVLSKFELLYLVTVQLSLSIHLNNLLWIDHNIFNTHSCDEFICYLHFRSMFLCYSYLISMWYSYCNWGNETHKTVQCPCFQKYTTNYLNYLKQITEFLFFFSYKNLFLLCYLYMSGSMILYLYCNKLSVEMDTLFTLCYLLLILHISLILPK